MVRIPLRFSVPDLGDFSFHRSPTPAEGARMALLEAEYAGGLGALKKLDRTIVETRGEVRAILLSMLFREDGSRREPLAPDVVAQDPDEELDDLFRSDSFEHELKDLLNEALWMRDRLRFMAVCGVLLISPESWKDVADREVDADTFDAVHHAYRKADSAYRLGKQPASQT